MKPTTIARTASAIALVPLVGFSILLFWLHSPKALPVAALMVVPIGVNLAWLITGTRTIDLLPVLRRLKGWQAGLAIAAGWLLVLYSWACLWWLLKGVR